ncbi:MAG: VOC family protein [Fimbriimonadaceae bacterium]|nr:VOC family protein [Fimbriimonadaceae bacterium]QYK56172.1 MAG: VOC family protein [Fimbriimonadaceae bacterium]
MDFLLFYDVSDDYLERRGEFRESHLDYAWRAHLAGTLQMGGALADPADQAVLFFRAESAAVVEEFAQGDPYVTGGLVKEWRVRVWKTTVGTESADPLRPDGFPPFVTSVAPVLLVRNVVEAAKFWEEKLGFAAELFNEPPTFGMVRRGGATVMLAQVPHGAAITPNWKIAGKTNNAYIWVDDARAMYAEVQKKGAPIDFTLYDTPWGTREFGVQDLEGHDIAFGQVLRKRG